MEAARLFVMGPSMLLIPTLPSFWRRRRMNVRGCVPQTPGEDCYCLIQSADTSSPRL